MLLLDGRNLELGGRERRGVPSFNQIAAAVMLGSASMNLKRLGPLARDVIDDLLLFASRV